MVYIKLNKFIGFLFALVFIFVPAIFIYLFYIYYGIQHDYFTSLYFISYLVLMAIILWIGKKFQIHINKKVLLEIIHQMNLCTDHESVFKKYNCIIISFRKIKAEKILLYEINYRPPSILFTSSYDFVEIIEFDSLSKKWKIKKALASDYI